MGGKGEEEEVIKLKNIATTRSRTRLTRSHEKIPSVQSHPRVDEWDVNSVTFADDINLMAANNIGTDCLTDSLTARMHTECRSANKKRNISPSMLYSLIFHSWLVMNSLVLVITKHVSNSLSESRRTRIINKYMKSAVCWC